MSTVVDQTIPAPPPMTANRRYRIAVQDLRLNMFVVELDRPWLDTPFLLQGFLIDDQVELDTLARYCNYVYVDLELSSPSVAMDIRVADANFGRLSAETQFHIDTLGVEGRLIALQHAELVGEFTGLDEQLRTDYAHNLTDPALFTLEPLHNFSAEELLSSQLVAERIGFGESPYLETPIHTRGTRLLISVGRLSEGMTTKLINRFSLQELFSVSVSELQQLEGIGSARARLIRDALLRITKAAYTRPQTPV